MKKKNNNNGLFPQFEREFFDAREDFTWIGTGSQGGKASGLAFIKKIIEEKLDTSKYPQIEINIPRLTVIRTDIFDTFMKENDLYEIAFSNESDVRIANEFQKADLPAEIVGDLRALIEKVKLPLAVRSSSMLEDNREEPFAGIYATKMIPNNQHSVDTRFKKLTEAIKFVYASTFLKASKDYFKSVSHSIKDEKMAVIIQEVVGDRFNDEFYPNMSGVARSYNFYPTGRFKPEQGVVNLALGLGKTIVEGGITWSYCPAFPKSVPPFADPRDMIKNTQSRFWAINMGQIPSYDPIEEVEYLSNFDLTIAEEQENLGLIASTYDGDADKIVMGIGNEGPRVLNFAPLLQLNQYNFNSLIIELLKTCDEAVKNPVEIEFALTLNKKEDKMRFGFLQVRPMVVSSEVVDISEDEMYSEELLTASEKCLGNGIIDNIKDVVYVKPHVFDKKNTPEIAKELDEINKYLVDKKIPYLLIGFGRWGSSDPWLGIPVEWGQIGGVSVIVESTLPDMNVELSQGSHFFHNLTSFEVNYFSVHHSGKYRIDWDWLDEQQVIKEDKFVKHAKLKSPLKIKVDGKTGKGVILK